MNPDTHSLPTGAPPPTPLPEPSDFHLLPLVPNAATREALEEARRGALTAVRPPSPPCRSPVAFAP